MRALVNICCKCFWSSLFFIFLSEKHPDCMLLLPKPTELITHP